VILANARVIFAAHRTWRLAHGAADTDPFFAHPHEGTWATSRT
jgi:hypothetical protein